jgi:4-hydroxy-4-methyl-2-oxoglutarate aldolase
VIDYAAFARLGVATVHEAAGRTGIVDLALTQVVPGSRVAGPARIALCAPRDNTMAHAAIAHANPGDVLVFPSAQPEPYALIGELMATQAQTRGVAGILVDGAVRDLDELAAMGLPVWARFVGSRRDGLRRCDGVAGRAGRRSSASGRPARGT